MASDVIGVNSVFVSGKDTKYTDHLLENNILDEPLYENGEIIKKLLQANNKLSKSLMRIHEENLNPVKEENIYENITFDENRLNTINEIKNLKPILKDDTNQEVKENDLPKEIRNNINNNEETLESSKNVYRSTFSFTIGKPNAPSTAPLNAPSEENELNFNINTSKMPERVEESDDGSFKSSYAKSLIDSYRKSTPNIHTNAVPEEKTFVRQTVTQDLKTQNELDSIQIQPKVYGPVNLDGQSRLIEGLECKISSLTDNILLKDKELDKIRQELMFMKLECNRVKAENRSLKASLNNELSSRSLMLNVDGHPHSPVSSISSDSDTWTLQQQIMSLNSQLEKAELSRHAYEAATKQLVHFLHTINSTLTTVGGPDGNFQSPFTPQNTSELLTNLETTLMENRGRTIPPKIKTNPYFDNSRDGSYLASKTDFRSHLESDRKLSFSPKTESNISPSSYKERENIRSSREDSNTEGKDSPPQPILAVCDRKEDSEAIVVNLKDVSCIKNKKSTDGKDEGKKRSSPQRRFSISQKIWNSTKRPLVRSGSVNNLPTELSAYPRVSRAVSSHCVALGKLETLPNDCDEVSEPSSTPSQRINKSSKAKDFFSSLKNLFKPEDRPPQEVSKKKSSSQALHKNSKVKTDFLSSSSASSSSSHSLVSPAAATNLKKRHSMKTPSVASRESPLHEAEAQTSTPNSIFYVPFRCSPKDPEIRMLSQEDRGTTKFAKATTLQEEEEETEDESMSGPQELSLTLSKESEDVMDTPTSLKSEEEERLQLPLRAPFLTYVTGGGTSSTLCISNDDVYSSALSNNDINKYLKTYGKVDGTKSLELEERSSIWKEKLPRVKSCRGPELANVEKGTDRRTSRGLSRRKSDFDVVGLKLWKLSRESFRSKACRLEFV